MVASRDDASLDRVCNALSQHPEFQIICDSQFSPANELKRLDDHSLVILDVDDLSDMTATLRTIAGSKPALLCICSEKNLAKFVQASRETSGYFMGAGCNVILKPVRADELLDLAQRAMWEKEQFGLLAEKYRKMRQLVRRVVRERRDINRRVELVCRDLVEAHRRLTYRFVELQKSQPTT